MRLQKRMMKLSEKSFNLKFGKIKESAIDGYQGVSYEHFYVYNEDTQQTTILIDGANGETITINSIPSEDRLCGKIIISNPDECQISVYILDFDTFKENVTSEVLNKMILETE